MAKQIIILSKQNETNFFKVNYLLWLAVPLAQQPFRANDSLVSMYASASSDEVTALRNGSVYELPCISSYNIGTTAATIKADLIAKYAIEQTNLNNDNQFNYYGTYYDGATWTNSGA